MKNCQVLNVISETLGTFKDLDPSVVFTQICNKVFSQLLLEICPKDY